MFLLFFTCPHESGRKHWKENEGGEGKTTERNEEAFFVVLLVVAKSLWTQILTIRVYDSHSNKTEKIETRVFQLMPLASYLHPVITDNVGELVRLCVA